MTLDQYVKRVGLLGKTELDKVVYLAYYYKQIEGIEEVSANVIGEWFNTLNLGQPNLTRLVGRISKSRSFVRATGLRTFKLHARTLETLKGELPFLNTTSEEIVFTPIILPESLFSGTRGYIERLAKQINASYDHNLFDGCAVLMRRLLEILLIHSYEHAGIEARIKTSSGDYKDLKIIISDAQANMTLGLSKAAKSCLDEFRVLGNFSAHKIIYNCRRDDIKNVALDYRATIEELLYKAGLRK